MLEELQGQLEEMDFVKEYYRAAEEDNEEGMYAEEYYLEDPGDLRMVPMMSPNPAIGDDFPSQRSSPEFNYQLKQKSNQLR
jgi:hypothetical protein